MNKYKDIVNLQGAEACHGGRPPTACLRKDDDWVKTVLPWRAKEPERGRPRKSWKDVVDKDMNDLHI